MIILEKEITFMETEKDERVGSQEEWVSLIIQSDMVGGCRGSGFGLAWEEATKKRRKLLTKEHSQSQYPQTTHSCGAFFYVFMRLFVC